LTENGNHPILVGSITHPEETGTREVTTGMNNTDRRFLRNISWVEQFASLGHWEWDVVTGETFWSEGTYRIFHLNPDEIELNFDRMVELVHPEDREEALAKVQAALAGKIPYELEFRVRLPNGMERQLVNRAEISRDEQGNPIHLRGIVLDVTEQKMLESSLKESEQRYRAITDTAMDAIFCKDVGRRYTVVNPAMVRLFNCRPEDLIGKTPEQLFDPVAAAIIKEVDDRTFGGEPTDEVKTLDIHGKPHVFHTIQVPLPSSDGEIHSICGIVRDVTEYDKAQREKAALESKLLQIQKMESIGVLAGGIAHDFNNMLGVILGNISFALSRMSPTANLHEVLREAQDGAVSAQSLTQQLLTFARGGAPIKKVICLTDLLRESGELFTSGTPVECAYELIDDLWPVEVDPSQLSQAVNNLVLNASQAMPDGGLIRIRSENIVLDSETSLPLPAGRHIKVSIEDQGEGIPPEHLQKVFDPYFTSKAEGSGLGLATTFSIIKRHKGFISVESEPGEGSLFEMYVPASSKTVSTTDLPTYATHHGSGRILVMDDNKSILSMVDRMLDLMGYETILASDGSEAIEMYGDLLSSGISVDAVILDLTVPGGMGGVKTISELLKMNPDICAIVSSGYFNDPVMADYKSYGFSGIVPKPYTMNQLAEVLNSLFAD